MVKCSSCKRNECKGKYENRKRCDDPSSCSCTCLEPASQTITNGLISLACGASVVAGGVALTVLTGGLGAIVAGGALIGGGASLMTNPITKKMSGERQTISDVVSDVAVGSIVGVASGGLSVVGSSLAKGAGTVAKVAAQVGAATATGATGGVVGETARAIKGEEVSAESFVKAVGVGAVCGMAGGIGGQTANSLSQSMSSQMTRAGTRVVVQAATAGATDAALQVCESGEVDFKRTLVTAASAATVATTAECAKVASMNTNLYADKVNQKLIEETKANKNISPDQERTLKEQLNNMNSNSEKQESIKAMLNSENLEELSKAKNTLDSLDAEKKRVMSDLKEYKESMRPNPNEDRFSASLFDLEKEGLQSRLENIRESRQTPAKIVSDSYDRSSQNLHPLTGDHSGQMAFDLPDENQGRGKARVVVDIRDGRAYLSDITTGHNYDEVNKPGERVLPREPDTRKLPNQENFGRKNQKRRLDEEEQKKDK